MAQPLPGIEHIVVLMLENRSFDNVLGRLYPSLAPDQFDGLPLDSTNPPPAPGTQPVKVWNDGEWTYDSMQIPFPDPGESYTDMTTQIFGVDSDAGSPNMQGFVQNYAVQKEQGNKSPVPADIMHYFTPGDLPVSNGLAAAFAVSDAWYASGPVQTFPNRQFLIAGTPGHRLLVPLTEDYEYVPFLGAIDDTTIFEALDGAHPGEANWKLYFHDYPIAWLSKYVWEATKDAGPNIGNYDDSDWGKYSLGPTFVQDVANGTLPKLSLIEPRYAADISPAGLPPNSNHPGNSYAIGQGPPINTFYGEILLLDLYANLCANPELFAKTLVIVTYDEHGGCYDHQSPGAATSPFTSPMVGFKYDRFGVRVPTFFLNPRIPAGTIARASGDTPYDHTSVVATARAQWGISDSLTPRDAAAPVIELPLSTGEALNLPPAGDFAMPGPAPAWPSGNTSEGPGNPMRGFVEALREQVDRYAPGPRD